MVNKSSVFLLLIFVSQFVCAENYISYEPVNCVVKYSNGATKEECITLLGGYRPAVVGILCENGDEVVWSYPMRLVGSVDNGGLSRTNGRFVILQWRVINGRLHYVLGENNELVSGTFTNLSAEVTKTFWMDFDKDGPTCQLVENYVVSGRHQDAQQA